MFWLYFSVKCYDIFFQLLVISIKLKEKEIFRNIPIFYFAANEYNFIKILHIFLKVYSPYIILGPKIK
jgi:hypothetical protein